MFDPHLHRPQSTTSWFLLFLLYQNPRHQYGTLKEGMDPPELPECPVCLQSFDGESIIPRVLACGHSTCETCLIDLPKPPFPCTIRCPACTQLVSYPPQGPSALPKNIDLLRISSSLVQSNPNRLNPKPKTPTVSSPDFIPNFWSHEFYYNWKEWVIPQDTISVDSSVALDGVLLNGMVINSDASSSSGPSSRCSMKSHQKVSLFKVGFFTHNEEEKLNYSYIAKVMWILFKMRDISLAELTLILTSSLKEHRICTAYGLWYNKENEHLYLVCERKHTTLLNLILSNIQEDISSFAMIGMELCETIIQLHESKLVTGCTSLSCFGIDDYVHLSINLNDVFMVGYRIQNMITETLPISENKESKKLEMEMYTFPSPELLVEFVKKKDVDFDFDFVNSTISYSSDVWSITCVLLLFLIGKSFGEETHNFLCSYIFALINGNGVECKGLYMTWLDKISCLLDTRLGSNYVLMKDLLQKCLCLDTKTRPDVTQLWKCMRELIIKPKFEVIGSFEEKTIDKSTCHCLLLGDFSWPLKKTNKVDKNGFKDGELDVNSGVIEGISGNSLKCTDLKGHLDCISGLAIGGGFLLSSSFDKTVNVWSLQGLNHVHTFKGHEHKVMAIVLVNREPPLCISADNGGDIFIWTIKFPFEEKPFQRLNEEKDWRYSGIHALAVSEAGYFYTGSGDKSIKAWSMHDYTLSCTMTGHKSVVSTLAVCNEVLYSGSWDGTIRLWCLSDHSPLAVLGEEASGTSTFGSILSVSANNQTLVAAHENGHIKIWNKDVPLNPFSAHTNSIFSIYMEGQWLFSGGWNKTVLVQKLSGDDVTQIGSIVGDSVVTALLYWNGKLFVGQADRLIKVYSFGG
ncbi:hypothetical protein L2E82_38833 [Cichorium intybus]|uniref:Uncharacterized protein n=1 Tax=Cichorium intybus TaxID=13427 RepID=A0ACB9AGD0_CICIN|nr:hypothetical protein L2E82_38833 [Cichorium intybus]